MNWHVIYEHLIIKLRELLQTTWGWFLLLCSFLVDFFAGYKMAIAGIVIVVALDAFWGIWAAIKQGKYARSELARDTLSKIAAYGSAVLITIMIEHVIQWDSIFLTSVIAALICATELWSISGNILIVNPKAHFFKLLRPVLKGEIARKLGIGEDKVDEALDGSDPKKETTDNAETSDQ